MFNCKEGVKFIGSYQEVKRRTLETHFELTRDGYFGYDRARGIKSREVPGKAYQLEGYQDLVRQINGDNLSEKIDEAVRNNTTVPILDVCTGRARFLRECMQVPQWTDKLQPSGIDLHDWTRASDNSDIFDRPPEEALKGIEIKTGDAQDLADYYQDKSFTVITAMFGLIYFADPLSTLQDIYNLLKPDGMAYIFSCPLPIADDQERKWFRDYMKDQGIECSQDFGSTNGASIAVKRKNNEPVKFPLLYDGWSEAGWEMTERFKYKLQR